MSEEGAAAASAAVAVGAGGSIWTASSAAATEGAAPERAEATGEAWGGVDGDVDGGAVVVVVVAFWTGAPDGPAGGWTAVPVSVVGRAEEAFAVGEVVAWPPGAWGCAT